MFSHVLKLYCLTSFAYVIEDVAQLPPAATSRRSLRETTAAAGEKVPPHAFFLVGAVFHYLGPSFAVLLFAHVDVLGVAWLRIASAALVFALWRRPWRTWAELARSARLLLAGWGAVLAVMNCCFYLAIDRLPLGTVAAIEFLPVIVLAALGARTARNAVALLLAVPGVYLLTDVVVLAQIPSALEVLGVALVVAGVGLHRDAGAAAS